jgi:hypothetical protein
MGTSAARRAPTTRLWRLAKGAATRYLSPEGGGAVTAGEVTARYLAALGEDGPGALAAFRLTRKVAQDLGAAAAQGWEEALNSWGLGELAGESPEAAAHGVAAALAGADGGLEAAAARASLVRVLPPAGAASLHATAAEGEPGRLVSRFLAAALHLRLALDLGEPLEAAAGSYRRIRNGLGELQAWIERAAAPSAPEAPEAPGDPEAWRGLAGWTWVTRVMEMMISRLRTIHKFE